MRPEKQDKVYYYTVPFCSHLVQKPVLEVSVHTDVEAMLNLAEWAVNKNNAKRTKYTALFILFKN